MLNLLICLFLLATTMASSSRILDELPGAFDPTPDNTDVTPAFTQPSGHFPATLPPDASEPDISSSTTPVTNSSSTTTPATRTLGGVAASAASGSTTADHPPLSFFMHDILGGSHPSGRVVTGIVANSNTNNQIFPINGGLPLNTINGAINSNNFPSLISLNGSPTNTGSNQAFVTAGQLPAGVTLQQLLFGSVTVVDNEITEAHELGSAVLGKAQGFYLASSSDGSSHTLALTALFHGHDLEIEDTVSFFGVHRTATPISHIAIIGGTGRYENARGYATVETLPHEDQHTTDGLETITHFTLYLTP